MIDTSSEGNIEPLYIKSPSGVKWVVRILSLGQACKKGESPVTLTIYGKPTPCAVTPMGNRKARRAEYVLVKKGRI